METVENKAANKEVALGDQETLEQLAKDMKKSRKHERTQAAMSVIRTLVSIATLALVCYVLWGLLPKVNAILDEVNSITTEINSMDLAGMTESVTKLAEDGSAGIGTALGEVSKAIGVLEELDIEGLNSSIEDLGAVLEPMSKFFGTGKR